MADINVREVGRRMMNSGHFPLGKVLTAAAEGARGELGTLRITSGTSDDHARSEQVLPNPHLIMKF